MRHFNIRAILAATPSVDSNWFGKKSTKIPKGFDISGHWAMSLINCSCSVAQSCATLCNPMDFCTPGFPALHHLPELDQTHVHWVGDAIQSSHPLSLLLLPPSIFPSIRVFSNESVLHIRWPEYLSFSFSTSHSNEYLGLISFRIDWFDLLAVQGTIAKYFFF